MEATFLRMVADLTPYDTIKRLEAVDGLPPAHARTLESLRVCLERAGIKFVGTIDNAPGVCLMNARSINVLEGSSGVN